MPFPKLRLKKSKQQYNVASKAMYVITVELLDNNQLECTLTAESTGKQAHHQWTWCWGVSSVTYFGNYMCVSQQVFVKISILLSEILETWKKLSNRSEIPIV